MASIADAFARGQEQKFQRGQRDRTTQQQSQLQALGAQAFGFPQQQQSSQFDLANLIGLGAPKAAPLRQQPSQAQSALQFAVQFPDEFAKVQNSLGLINQDKTNRAADFGFQLTSTPFEQRRPLIERRIADLIARGDDPTDSRELLDMTEEEQNQAAEFAQVSALSPQQRIDRLTGADKPAGQREFEAATKGLTDEQVSEATLIKLGLAPRAVGSAIQTISTQGIAEQIGDVEATIAGRKKFGELSGTARAKSIDSGFERIGKIDAGVRTIDRAIQAIESGAGTGAIEKMLPSIRAASVELEQIGNQLALDVIGGVTLGAISEAELNLAKQVALPVGLDGPELIQHLNDRKAAQLKLRDYFNDQIQFLDQGGTVAGFLRERERQLTPQEEAAQAQDVASAEPAPQEAQAAAAPTVTSQAEFDALPSGASFIEDGVTYRKP